MSTQNTQLVTHLGPAESYTLFGKNGVMEQNQRVHLAKGTFLYAYGYAMSEQHFVIYDDDMNAVEICDGDPAAICTGDLERYFSPFHKVSETTKSITEVFGIGFYYDETQIVSDEVIAKSLERAHALTRLAQQEKERKAKEKEETRKRLATEYAYLERNEKDDHNIVGKNIRTELKRNFPGVKFSVRYDSFSGGDAFDIRWEDGPTSDQVDPIVNKYGNMHPDAYSQGDYWDCVPSVFNELFGGVGYVNIDRTITEKAIEAMRKKYPDLTEENKTTYHFEEERAGFYARENESHSVESILRVAACYVDFTPKRKESDTESKPSAPQDTPNSFQVIDYNERCIVVIGDTKPLSGQLKKLGIFNSRLSCGPGWAFSRKNKEHLKEADKLLRGAISSQFPELLKGGE